MNGQGVLSPEALDDMERSRAYYGGAGLSSPAAEPPPAGPPVPPTAPPPTPYGQTDTAAYFGPAPSTGQAPPPPAPPEGVSTWNPAEQTNADAARFMGKTPSPGPGVPSTTALRAGSEQMNAEAAGAPPAPAVTRSQADAARALAYYGGAGAAGERKPPGGGARGLSDYEKGEKALRATYDEDKGATQRGATAEEDRASLIADGAQRIAQEKQQDQAIQQMEAANAADHFKTYQEETQRQIDDVKAQKIQPNRLYADTGSAFMAVIGGALGGLYMGLNHLDHNPFIDQMNKNIDRDIAVQEANLRTKKESIGERKGMLAEMRATYKDEALAKIQARNLYYEGAKEDLAAQASQYDSPAIQARADQAITAISREQAKLDINDAIRKAAAAQAAGSAAAAQAQRDFENRLKLHSAQVEDRKLDIEAGKEGGKQGAGDAARFVGTGKDAQGNPTGYLERNAEGAKEREDSRIAAQSLLKNIDRAQEIRREQGPAGRAVNRGGYVYSPEWRNQLKVLEASMTIQAAKAAKLGALSESDRQLLTDQISGLDNVGGSADDRLNELRRITQAQLDAEKEAASGPRATKMMGPDGRERVIVNGTSNALNNDKVTPRERVGP